ncbi:MAG: LysR family transcriptional regulator [Clostridia bacterium]|nr:LysR family transcriptional regulator [Clostridia bacterium]
MEIEQLECIVAVVKNKTFLDAAAALNRSQSSLSKSIRRLEEELGV